LAQLYTNAELRDQFFSDPMSIGMGLGLTAKEALEIAGMSGSQVSFFAQSLQRKRLNEISKMLPLTQRALGRRFGMIFEQYLKIQAPPCARSMPEELLDFAAFLQTTLPAEEFDASLRDCLRYEAAWVKASRPNCRLLVRWFPSLRVDLTGGWKEENRNLSPVIRSVLVIWIRLWPRGRLRRFSFPSTPWKPRRKERMQPWISAHEPGRADILSAGSGGILPRGPQGRDAP
jgi:hypothetical protein